MGCRDITSSYSLEIIMKNCAKRKGRRINIKHHMSGSHTTDYYKSLQAGAIKLRDKKTDKTLM